MAKDSFNTPIPENNNGMVMLEKQIKDCDNHNLFNFVNSHFAIFFLDLQELRKFVSYLYEKKGESLVRETLGNFDEVLKEFRQN